MRSRAAKSTCVTLRADGAREKHPAPDSPGLHVGSRARRPRSLISDFPEVAPAAGVELGAWPTVAAQDAAYERRVPSRAMALSLLVIAAACWGVSSALSKVALEQ